MTELDVASAKKIVLEKYPDAGCFYDDEMRWIAKHFIVWANGEEIGYPTLTEDDAWIAAVERMMEKK